MILLKINADDKATVTLGKVGKAAKGLEVQLLTLGDIMKTALGTAMAYIGLRQMGNSLMYLTTKANDYELALKKIEVIGGVAKESLKEFDTISKALANSTEHSATAIAMAGLEIVKMGYSVENTKEVLPDALNLATFASEDLQWSATNMINVMKSFQLSSGESGRVSDVMSLAMNKTSLNLKDLMEGYQYVAPIAKSMNYSFEETTALLGFLSDISIRASHGGTSLKNTMLKLLDPTGEAGEALKGVNLQGKRLVEVLEILKTKNVSISGMFKQFDIRAMTSALAIGDNAGYIKDLIAILEGGGNGAAKKGAEAIRESYEMQWKGLRNELELLGIAFNEALGTEQTTLVQNLKSKVGELIDYVYKNREGIQQTASELNSTLKQALFLIGIAIKGISENWKLIFGGLAINQVAGMTMKIVSLGTKLDGTLIVSREISKSFGSWAGSITAATAAGVGIKTVLEGIAENRMGQVDTSQNNLTKDNYSDKRLEMLKNIKDAYLEIEEVKEGSGWNENQKSAHPEWKRLTEENRKLLIDKKLQLTRYLQDYRNLYEVGMVQSKDFSGSIVKDLQTVSNEYNNVRVLNQKYLHATKVETVDNSSKRPRNGPPEDKKEKNDDPYGDKDAYERLLRIDNFNKKMKAARLEANEDFYKLDQDNADRMKDLQREYREDEIKSEEDQVDRMIELQENYLKERKEAVLSIQQDSIKIAQDIADIFLTISDKRTDREIENLEKEKAALEDKYAKEDALLEERSQFEILRDKKRAAEKEKIDKQITQKQKEQNRRDFARMVIQANANAAQAIIGAIAQTQGGVASKLAAGVAVGAVVLGEVANLASYDYSQLRDGSHGAWLGNDTSDSNFAKISRGEMLIRARDVKRAGGEERVKQLIDAPSRSVGEVHIHVEKYYGSKTFTREIITAVRKELVR